MATVDLTPFRFTATESVVYSALLRLGRATGSVQGILSAELWRPTLPAWRRAATRAVIDVRLAGESAETEGIVKGTVAAATPTVLLIDDSQLLTAAGAGEQITALWSSHPLLITLAQVALRNLA